uniref:Uncharacterized protein n=1 Tax=Arundo donax TaxID=35708 RepID=A0A0A9B7Z6_ARUDO
MTWLERCSGARSETLQLENKTMYMCNISS